MLGMGMPVGGVFGSEAGTADHQEVFRVVLLGGFGEIESARHDRLVVDNHDLVVGDGVLGVDLRRDARMDHEIRRRVLSRPSGSCRG